MHDLLEYNLYSEMTMNPILVSIKFGDFSFEAAVGERLMLWTGTNSTRIRTPSR